MANICAPLTASVDCAPIVPAARFDRVYASAGSAALPPFAVNTMAFFAGLFACAGATRWTIPVVEFVILLMVLP
ncbi:hypothetical protein [Bartonella tamiae]|uniref:hypothetical protein n=1 Tax=Bartonella tamiae TaxID=373638 RepID=UPI000552061C|nr:hypothetical protein [Bartonella tamiae]